MNKSKHMISDSVFTKIVAVITALSLVFLQVPISGMTAGARAEAANNAKEKAAQQEAVDIDLSFEHAYIIYDDQVIGEPATKVTIPADSAFKFEAEADSDYQLESVVAVIDGDEVELSPKKGVYKLSADEVAETEELIVSAVTAPVVEVDEEEVDADAAKEQEAAPEAAATEEPAANAENAAATESANAPEAASANGEKAGTESAESKSAEGAADAAAVGAATSDVKAGSESAATASEPSSSSSAASKDASDSKKAEKDVAAATSKNTKTTYIYEDDAVKVTAELSNAKAVPENTEFRVTPVTPSSSDYNYGAYMDALNGNSDNPEYTDENTLLYDIAFMAPKVDEKGKVVEGEMVEVDLAVGDVAIDFQFKKQQLTEDLGVEAKADSPDAPAATEAVEVVHLPLTEGAKKGTDSTEQATNISANDVIVDVVKPKDASVDGVEKVEFKTDSLCVFAFKSTQDAWAHSWEGSATINVQDFINQLGVAADVGIYADKFINHWGGVGHLESAIAVNTYSLHDAEGRMNVNDRVVPFNSVKSITISKTLQQALDEDATFKFAAYKDESGATPIDGSAVQIRIPKGETSGSVELTADGYSGLLEYLKARPIYIYEIDDQNNPVLPGATYKDAAGADKYDVSYSINSTASSEIDSTVERLSNYIGNFDVTAEPVPQPDWWNEQWHGAWDPTCVVDYKIFGTPRDGVGFHAYLGSDSVEANLDNGYAVIDNSSGQRVLKIEHYGQYYGSDPSTYIHNLGPEEFEHVTGISSNLGTGGNFANLSALLGTAKRGTVSGKDTFNVINVESQYGNLASDIEDAAGFKSTRNGEAVSELLNKVENEDEYLLINIDATGYDSYNLTQLRIDGYSPDGGPGADSQFTPLSSHVVYNFLQKDASGNLVPYTGKITNSEVVGGLVFAPCAEVDQKDGIFGGIIAETLDRTQASGEMHQKTVGSSEDRYVTVSVGNAPAGEGNNDANTVVSFAGSKSLEGRAFKDGDTFTFKVEGSEGAPMPSGIDPQTGLITITPQLGTAPAAIAFGDITYGAADAGKSYTYTVKEVAPAENEKLSGVAYDGTVYTVNVGISATAGGLTATTQVLKDGELFNGGKDSLAFTNTYEAETTEATVKKVWDDANNQDGIRPVELTVTLSNGKTATLNAGNNWEATIEGLPKYDANDQLIDYTWTEGALPDGYTLTSSNKAGTVTTITNSHTPATTEAKVKKVWNDANNQDGKRPAELTVTLSNGQTATLNAGNNWEATVTGLPKYDNGQLIDYTWTESALPEGYTLTSNSTVGTITTLTNSYSTETTEATVKKVWNDANNQDGKRPAELTVTLSNGQTATLNAGNNWQATVTGLPKYDNGQLIDYTWTEGALPDGYTLTSNSKEGTITTLTNSYTPETTEVRVKKVWNDANNQEGFRPESLRVNLSNGMHVDLSEANNWEASIGNLPVYRDGVKINYSWSEAAVPEGYTLSGSVTEGNLTTITNTRTPEYTDVSVRKVWEDNNNQDGKRPAELTVTLSNGQTVTLNAGNNWEGTIEHLPKYANGTEISYSWAEPTIEGYTLTGTVTNGQITTLTNKHDAETTSATVRKVWDDAENQDGIRPSELEVKLSDGQSVKLNAKNNWTATINDLPAYSNGQKINYTWTEGTLPEGYSLTDTSVNGTITTLTNKHVPELTTASVRKVWNDAENQDGKRPDTLSVVLSNGETVTLSKENGWTATVINLPKYAAGVEIDYTWKEASMPQGYTLTNTSKEGTITTLTNSYTPETTDASVKKVWDDANNQDGKRPDSLTVMLSNGDEVTLDQSNNWEKTVTGLPKYDKGQLIDYTWTEGALPEGYTLKSIGKVATLTTITNAYTPETTQATVKKVWNDSNNQDGKRPDSLTVRLSNDETVTLNEDNKWEATIDGLPKYANGALIEYSWTEEGLPDGYKLTNTATETTADGTITTLTNTHEAETTSATVRKVWNDANNQDGKRPTELTVKLSNGAEVTLNEGNKWEATIDGLPKYANGTLIEYSWTEEGLSKEYALTNTATETTADGTITTLTNTHNAETTSATVRKVWDDADNQDGIRPAELTVALSNGQTVTLNEANEWQGTINNLPAYADGQLINYTWTEGTLPEGYSLTDTSVNGTITTLTNTHAPAETQATVRKVWDDADNQDGIRPQSLMVTLSDGQTVTLSKANDWQETITGLPVNANGQPITYTWTETGLPEGYTLTNTATETTAEGSVTTLTNTHVPALTEATVKKVWDDADNQDGIRPQSLTVTLSNGQEVTLNAGNNWQATIGNLPKYAAGKLVEYTWTESGLPKGYKLTNTATEDAAEVTTEGAVDGVITTLTNTHEIEKISIPVSKIWHDTENRNGKQPASVMVRLLANGTEVRAQELNAGNNWSYTFTDLDKFNAGSEVKYTVAEDAVEGYTAAIQNGVVTNTLDTGGLTVTKTVENATIAKSFSFTVTLDDKTINGLYGGMTFTDGVAEFELANGGSVEASGLPTGIGYTVSEGQADGYTTTSTGETGTIATNEVGTAAFTNTYHAESSAKMKAVKTVTPTYIDEQSATNNVPTTTAGKFEFMLEGDGIESALTVKNNGDGTASFGQAAASQTGVEPIMKYTEADAGKTFNYVMSEVDGGLPGFEYDTSRYEFSVTVTDNGDGTLGLAVDTKNNPGLKVETDEDGILRISAAFDNKYSAEGRAILHVTKLFNGAAPAEGAYKFRLADRLGNTIATTSNKADGSVDFGLTFHSPGDASYVIYEVTDDAVTLGDKLVANDVAYDTHGVQVSFTITDNGDGTLSFGDNAVLNDDGSYTLAEASGVSFKSVEVQRNEDGTVSFSRATKDGENDAVFNNESVESAKFPLSATKVITGREFHEGDSFTFSVAGSEGAPTPERSEVTITPTSGKEATVDFGNIEFKTADLGKAYTYTISEANAGVEANGLTNDPFSHWVKLTVGDAGDGTMNVTAEYQQNAEKGIVFTNTYEASGDAVLHATKTLEGRTLAADEFYFKATAKNQEAIEKTPATLHASAAADGSVTFAPISFTQADVGKSFTYTISETQGALGGVTYDANSYDVTINVADNGNGTLAITYDYGAANEAPTFVNQYHADSTSAQLTAHKALVGGKLNGGEFTFELTGTSENAQGTSQRATNAADGSVKFDAIKYDAAGTYEYRVAEVIPDSAIDNGDGTFQGADGIVYDGTAHTATVTVVDNQAGNLVATVAYDDNAPGISFGNTKLVRTGFEFNKYYFGGVGTFNFKLTATDAQGKAREGSAVDYSDAATIVDDGTTPFQATVQNGAFNDGAAKVVFPEISYPADGDYYYLVEEAEASTQQVTVDKAQYLAHVVVKDQVATTTYEVLYNGENLGATTDLSFYNNSAVALGFNSLTAQGYTGEAERVSVYPTAEKYLNNVTGKDAGFVGGEFSFELIDDATGAVLAVATNDDTGHIAFFDESADHGLTYDEPGTYNYTLREVAGNEAGITYDTNTVSLTVTVEQTENGLQATTSYNGAGGSEPAFYNMKEGMDITVQKVSRYGGEGLENCTYALYMVGDNGDALIQEAVSDAEGYITFKDVSLLAGQKYYFKEVAAPAGHTVDPYRTAYFSLNAAGDALVLVEDTAPDGWHSATEKTN